MRITEPEQPVATITRTFAVEDGPRIESPYATRYTHFQVAQVNVTYAWNPDAQDWEVAGSTSVSYQGPWIKKDGNRSTVWAAQQWPPFSFRRNPAVMPWLAELVGAGRPQPAPPVAQWAEALTLDNDES